MATPVVVYGRNERLRSRLNRAAVPALGWVTDMPLLMRAVDVLVENAGGLARQLPKMIAVACCPARLNRRSSS